jgi:hypothetical protein
MDNNEIILHIEEVNQVASEYIKGKDASAISKELDIPRNRVLNLLNEWRNMVANNEAVRIRAREALAGADQHYNHLIRQAYEVIEDATTTANLSAKTAAIKLVMDIESKRIDMLQKAGLLENKELADQLLEQEQKQDVLVGILREVSGDCPRCRNEVAKRLAQISGQGEVITVEHS